MTGTAAKRRAYNVVDCADADGVDDVEHEL